MAGGSDVITGTKANWKKSDRLADGGARKSRKDAPTEASPGDELDGHEGGPFGPVR